MLGLHRFRWIVGICALAALPLGFLASAQAQAVDPAGVESCTPLLPAGWVPYTVQAGDSLASIAAQFGVDEAQLPYLNCLRQRAQIQAGDMLFVPPGIPDQAPFNFALRCREQGYEPQVCSRMTAMLGEEAGERLQTRCREAGLAEEQCRWLVAYQYRHPINQNEYAPVAEPLCSCDRNRSCQTDCAPDRLQERDRERQSQPEAPAKGRGKGG